MKKVTTRGWSKMEGVNIACPMWESRTRDRLAPMVDAVGKAAEATDILCPFGPWKAQEQGWIKYRSVVDSGATLSCCPGSPEGGAVPGYEVRESPGSKRGQTFTSAANEVIPNMGEQILPAVTGEGRKTIIKHQVVPGLALPLTSVGEYCDAGNEVVFGKFGGFIRNLANGVETYFPRENGIFVLETWVPEASSWRDEAQTAAGFRRPGR